MEAIVLKKMSNKDFVAWMHRNGACSAARKWVGKKTLQNSWKRCTKSHWMWFFLYKFACKENNPKLRAYLWKLSGEEEDLSLDIYFSSAKSCALWRKYVVFE